MFWLESRKSYNHNTALLLIDVPGNVLMEIVWFKLDTDAGQQENAVVHENQSNFSYCATIFNRISFIIISIRENIMQMRTVAQSKSVFNNYNYY